MRKFLMSLLCFFSFAAGVFANFEDTKDGISGKITTSDKQPAAGVTILVKGRNRYAVTKEDGTFYVGRLQPGTYDLQISLTGYETVVRTITVEKDKASRIAIELALSKNELQGVIVSGRVAFNLNNVGNKEYYGGGWSTVNPQKPRNFAASFAYKF